MTGLAQPLDAPSRPVSTRAIGLALAAILVLGTAALAQIPANQWPSVADLLMGRPLAPLTQALLLHHYAPRLAAGVFVGASLGLAGAALQAVMRNPLAAPDLLGATAGAQLALSLALVLLPSLPVSILLIALIGAIAATVLTVAVAGGIAAPPLRLLLAGVAVSLAAGAGSIALMLASEERAAGLALWVTGALTQTGWTNLRTTAPWGIAGGIGLVLLARGLDLLALGRETAQGLGLGVRRVEGVTALLATGLAALAVCVAGPIGLVGTLAPNILRLLGVRTHRALLPLAGLWGAALLVAADWVAVQLSTGALPIPAGVAITLLGSPLLYILVKRQRSPEAGARTREGVSAAPNRLRLFRWGGVLLAGLATALIAHWSASGLAAALYADLTLPRTVTALAAGALLGASGALLQGVIRNPLAGPELLGVAPGASVAALTLLLTWPTAGILGMQAAAFGGGLGALALVLLGSAKGGFGPARLALIGLVVGTLAGALARLLILDSRLHLGQALVWLSGSTYGRGWAAALALVIWASLLLPLAWLLAARLDLLALGRDTARGLGLAVGRARVEILLVAVACSAAAVAIVGAIGFIGLIAPHAARLLGARRGREQVIGAALLGALALGVADLIGRVVLAPRDVPAGLMTALFGAPYFLWLLRRVGR